MNALDLLAGLRRYLFGADTEVDAVDPERVAALAQAGDDSVTPRILRNDDGYAATPPVGYLEDDESVQHILHGSELAIGTPKEEDAMVEQPSTRTLTMVTSKRLLFVVGRRLNDALWSIPYEGVTGASLRRDDEGHMLVVHANYEDDARIFYVDLSLEHDTDALRDVMATLRASTTDIEPDDTDATTAG